MTKRPAARPVASTNARLNPRSGVGSLEIVTTKDSPSSSRLPRVTASHSQRIAGDMSHLDLDVTRFIKNHRLCSGDQLARRFWPGDEHDQRRARRALARLAEWQVLTRLPRRIGGVRAGSNGYLYALGPAGHRILSADGSSRRRDIPGDRFIAHTLAVSELVVRLAEAEASGRLEVLEIQSEPASWRPFAGSMGARLVLKPDLFVRVGVGSLEDRWQIEVDLGTESTPTVREKGRRYVQHFRAGTEQSRNGVYPRTLWAAIDAPRCQRITEALGGLPPATWQMFRVCQLDEVVGVLAEEAAS